MDSLFSTDIFPDDFFDMPQLSLCPDSPALGAPELSVDDCEPVVRIRFSTRDEIAPFIAEFGARRAAKPRTRPNFSFETRRALHEWIRAHGAATPRRGELDALADRTGLSLKQVRTFFTNYRARAKAHSSAAAEVM